MYNCLIRLPYRKLYKLKVFFYKFSIYRVIYKQDERENNVHSYMNLFKNEKKYLNYLKKGNLS